MTHVSVSAVSVRYWMTLGDIAPCLQGGASADTDGNRQDVCNERERENRSRLPRLQRVPDHPSIMMQGCLDMWILRCPCVLYVRTMQVPMVSRRARWSGSYRYVIRRAAARADDGRGYIVPGGLAPWQR